MSGPQRIVAGVVLGGLVGGAFAFLSGMLSKRAHKNQDLGYEWKHVMLDPALHQALNNLKAFKQPSEDMYWQIGQVCDNMVSLWCLVADPSIEGVGDWAFKAHQYRSHAQKMLIDLSEKLADIPARTMVDWRSPTEGQGQNVNMEEYRAVADEIMAILSNYQSNITLALGNKKLKTTSAPQPPKKE